MSSLYLHIPFCSSKCPYCDFYSQVGSQQQLNQYVELLLLHIDILARKEPTSSPLETIFFGGGTPSLLSIEQLGRIMDHMAQHLGIKNSAEITVEANPGTLSLAQLKGYRQVGINRLSLGIQSLSDRNLRMLGRVHSAAQAEESIRAARSAGFDNLNLDLMFALPNQDIKSLHDEISALISFEPEHVSLYGLSFEDGTEFYLKLQSGEIESAEEALYAEQYQLLHFHLARAGYEHYEISNFSRSGRRCRHNQVYWQRGACQAIGVGAHGFVDHGWGQRWHVPADLKRYRELLSQGNDPAELLEDFDLDGAMKEHVYLALRTSDGVDLHKFQKRFGLRFEQVFAAAILKTGQYLQTNSDYCHFNQNGWLIYDHLISHYL